MKRFVLFFALSVFLSAFARQQALAQCATTTDVEVCNQVGGSVIRVFFFDGLVPDSYILYSLPSFFPTHPLGVATINTSPTLPGGAVAGVEFANVPNGSYIVRANYTGQICPSTGFDYIVVGGLGITVNSASALTVTTGTIDADCGPGDDGQITVNVSGGTAPFNYTWSGPTAVAPGTLMAAGPITTPANLAQGTYSVTVTDANNCVTVRSGINVLGAPTITLGANPAVCTGTASSSISYSATTGSPDQFRIDWASGPADVPLTSLSPGSIPINGIPAGVGTYNGDVYVRNSTTGCESLANAISVTVNPNNTVGAASSTPTLCINTPLTNITHTTTGATGIGAPSNLPAGVSASWAANVITISGTPTASGTFNYSIPLTGGCGSFNATGTITVTPDNTAGAPSSTPTLCINTLMTDITHTTTGATGIGAATGLPAGVSASWAANVITISGTPSASGTFNYSIPLTGGCGTVNATGTITVNPTNTVGAPSSTPTLCINTALTNITHSTTGATGIGAPTGLPAGVSAAWAANVITISGTPSASGTFNYTIPLTGGCGSVNATGTITVNPANTAGAPSSTPTLCINTALTPITHATTGATGIGAPTGLPAGVSASWAANVITISGTPSASGTFNYSIPLTGGCGSVNATGTITVNPDNTVGAASSTPTLCINTALTNITHATTGATGIGAPTGLPAGVSAAWAANVITISGTPTSSGTFNYSIPLAGGCGSLNATGTITVTPDNTAGAPSSTPTLCINTALTNITHATTGATGIGAPVGLPAGVSASWAANVITISGTPSASGTFNYTIPLTGGCGTVNATGTITVNPVSTVGAGSSTPTLCINTALTNITHNTTDATGIGAATGLPAGVSASWAANVITISGTPSASGTFNYSIPVTGCGSATATGTITVTPDNTVGAASSTPTLCINTALTNITHTTTGATGIGVAAGLPAGVSASWAANVITISGTPSASGTFNYTIPLTGGCGSVDATGTITVNPDNTAGAPSSTPTVCVNVAIANITHATTGATGIGAATGLPAGLSAAWAANVITISGTPTGTGVFNYTIPLTGGCGTVNATGTITVNATNTVGAPSSTPTLCINTALTDITHSTTGATGIGAPTGLPAGVTATWLADVITISGTPSASGTFNYSIPLTGGCGTVNATGTITVTPDNTVGAASSTPTLCTNSPLTDITHATTGATGIGAAVGLPAGVSASWAANVITITGTPTANGVFNYSIPLTGGCGTVNATGTITVTPGNSVGAPSSTPTLCINTALTDITHATTGATGIGASTGLPAGVSASWAANVITITGTPTASGTFNYSIPLTGGCGSVNATGTIIVNPNNTVGAPSSTPTLCINTALTDITHTTTGATGIGAPIGLPAGVSASWAANVITITGTPTASGTFNYLIPLTGGCGVISAIGIISVNSDNTVGAASSTPTLCINTPLTAITHATTGATGIGAPTGLPAGVSASWAANVITISGTPTASGTFNYTIPLPGCGGVSATGTIVVTPDNTVGAPSSTPTLCINIALTNITHATTGASGIGAATGLPAGVSASWAADVITISGTPTASGTFNYSIPLNGGCGNINAVGTITVDPDNTVGAPSSTPTVCVNSPITNITHTTTGATGIGAPTGLPAGVSASWAANVITISGTPTANGTFNYSIPLTGGCNTVNATGTITVNPLPTASISYAGGPFCATGSVSVTQTGQAGGTYSSAAGLAINATTGEIDLASSSAGSYTVTYSFTDGTCPNTTTANVTVNTVPSASMAGTASVCVGQSTTISVALTGGGPWDLVYTDGSTNTTVNGIATSPYTFNVSPIISTTYSLVSVSNATCGSGSVSGSAVITVSPIGGNPATAGVDAWLAYVYDDSSTPGTYDFNATKYRGVINENDLLALRPGAVTYDATTDAFDMPLSNVFPVFGPSVCGSYLQFYSMRFRMQKTFAAGVYTFKVGSDDGVRIYVDGVNRALTQTSGGAPVAAWGLHSYTEFETAGICLSAGQHDLVIEYFEQSGLSRLSFDFEQIGAPTVSTPVALCVNSAAPTLTATSAGATGYRWYTDAALTNQVAATQNYTPLAADLDITVVGQTTFYVVGVYGCGQTPASAVVVDVIGSATLTAASNPYQVCQAAGTLDLTTVITATPSGGTFTFAGTGVTGNNFDVSQAVGTYTLTADYSTGSCNAPTLTFDVEIINNAVIAVPSSTTDVCELSTVDLLTLVSATPSGGTFTFTDITGGAPGVPIAGSTFDPAGLSGTVTIQVDYTAATCTDTKTFDLNVLAAPTMTTSNTTICANAGNLNLTTLVTVAPAGGTFTFTGSPAITGNFLNPSTLAGTTVNINVTYDIGGGCSVSTSTPIVVTVRALADPLCGTGGCTIIPTLAKTDASCAGKTDGSISINGIFGGTGPYQYSIDNGVTFQPIAALPTTVPNLAGNNYSVVIKDNTGCLSSVTTIIVGNTTTISGTVGKTDATCAGINGAINITNPTGGATPYEYSIDGGTTYQAAASFTGLGIGSYNVVIKDANGCISATTAIAIATPTNCTGGTGTCATVVIVPKPSPATCTNSNGKIVFSVKPFVPAVNNTGVKISITGTSPTNQTISRTIFNDSTFLNLPIGTYDYSIEYGDPSCTKTGQVTIDRSGTIGVPVVTNLVNPTCFGVPNGAATIDVPGETGNQLEWSLDGTLWNSFIAGNQITGLPAGDQVLSVRRNSSDPCASGALVSLVAPVEIKTTLTPTNASCNNNDGSIAVGAITGGTGPYTFQLNGSTIALPQSNVLPNLAAGTYILKITDAVACSKDFTVNVTFPGFVNHTAPVVTPPNCSGAGSNGVIQFQITDVGSFLFAYSTDPVVEPAVYNNAGNNIVTIPDLSNGTYYIWIKPNGSGAQCATKLAPVVVTGVYPVTADATTNDIACFGAKSSIVVENITGAPGVDFSYVLTNTDNNTSSTGAITATQALGSFTIADLGPGNYSLLVSQNQSALVSTCTTPISAPALSIEINAPANALDTLFVTRAISLPDLATGSVTVALQPSGSEPYEARIELVEPLLNSQAYLVDWTPVNINAQNLKFEHTFANVYGGVYELGIRDGAGCEKTYSIEVKVDTAISIPNIFTPNGDGVNELFYIRNLPSDAALVITNRWGKEVYSSGAYQNNWDGGEAADGVYFYKLTMPGESVTGWVEIVRGK